MLSYLSSFAILVAVETATLGMVTLLRRKLNPETRRRANGVNGWQLSILGSIYAVVLGFMLADSWAAFQKTSDAVRVEAQAAYVTYRAASVLPVSCRAPLQGAVNQYLADVIDTEWPSMADSRPTFTADAEIKQMWSTTKTCGIGNTDQSLAPAMQSIQVLQGQHDSRMADFEGHLPGILWCVLILGGSTVIAAACLLQNEKQWTHVFHVFSLTLLIALTLLGIYDLDRPFDGGTRIMPVALQRVRAAITE